MLLGLAALLAETDARRRRRGQGLKCWTCDNAASNEECLERGKVKRCRHNQKACQTTVRSFADGRKTIFKECKQAEACENNYMQNLQTAWYPPQCDLSVPDSVCRCCCGSNNCNKQSLDCSQSPMEPPKPPAPEISCQPEHTSITHGAVDCTNGNNIGSECRFSCNDGFMLVGIFHTICDMTPDGVGMWHSDPPVCAPIKPNSGGVCQPIDSPLNGIVSCTDPINSEPMTVCIFLCDPGYIRVGHGKSICRLQKNGRWQYNNPAPKCQLL